MATQTAISDYLNKSNVTTTSPTPSPAPVVTAAPLSTANKTALDAGNPVAKVPATPLSVINNPAQPGLYKEGPQSALGKQLSLRGIVYTPQDHQAMTKAKNAWTTASRGNDKAGMDAAHAAAEAIRAKYGFSGGADGNTFTELPKGGTTGGDTSGGGGTVDGGTGGTTTNPDLQTGDSELDKMLKLIDANKAEQLAAIKKQMDAAYEAEIAKIEGNFNIDKAEQERLKREVQDQYNAANVQINQSAYNEMEMNKLYNSQRGIDYSNQGQAINVGTLSRAGQQRIDASQNRDKALLNISERIALLIQQKGVDERIAGANRDAQLAQREGDIADKAFEQQLGLQQGEYEFNRESAYQDKVRQEEFKYQDKARQEEFKYQDKVRQEEYAYKDKERAAQFTHDFNMLSKQQQAELEKMAKAQGYTLEQMAKQNGYDINKMSKQQVFDLEKMAKQQGYDLKKMDVDFVQRMKEMAKSQEYNVNNMNLAFQQDLDKMFKAYGYDIDKMDAGLRIDMEKMAKQQGYTLDQMLQQHNNNVDEMLESFKYDKKKMRYAVDLEGIKADMDDTRVAMKLNPTQLAELDGIIQSIYDIWADGSANSNDKELQSKYRKLETLPWFANASITQKQKIRNILTDAANVAKNENYDPGILKKTWNFITGNARLNLKDTYDWNDSGFNKGSSSSTPKNTNSKLGALSKKYESSGNSTTINPGTWDKTGGKSYGTYQFAGRISSTGKWVSGFSPEKNEVQGFLNWLGKQSGGSAMANTLKSAKAKDGNKYGKNFDSAWKKVASTSAFKNLEHSYAVANWFTPAANSIAKAVGDKNLLNKLGPVLQDVLWSTAIQHGQGGATNIFKSVLKPGWEKKSKSQIIDAIYAKRSTYLGKLSSSVRAGVLKRFANEKADAKRMLG